MERRILDFGVNDTFESAAERWAIHYSTPISSFDRMGLRAERAASELTLQRACLPSPAMPAPALIVATAGVLALVLGDAGRNEHFGRPCFSRARNQPQDRWPLSCSAPTSSVRTERRLV